MHARTECVFLIEYKRGNIIIDFNKAPLLSTEFKEDTIIIV
jgi:hypothetical protein